MKAVNHQAISYSLERRVFFYCAAYMLLSDPFPTKAVLKLLCSCECFGCDEHTFSNRNCLIKKIPKTLVRNPKEQETVHWRMDPTCLPFLSSSPQEAKIACVPFGKTASKAHPGS